LQVNDEGIAPRKPEHLKGVKPFMDCDLVNFAQSSLPNELLLKMEDCCPQRQHTGASIARLMAGELHREHARIVGRNKSSLRALDSMLTSGYSFWKPTFSNCSEQSKDNWLVLILNWGRVNNQAFVRQAARYGNFVSHIITFP
jgi:hypothetical protein